MRLGVEILILALAMVLACVLPLSSAFVRRHSKSIFLLGTGAMVGICFFDLLPDVFQLGGGSSLFVAGAVWLAYTAVHLLHLTHHKHDFEEEEALGHPHASGFGLFFGSLWAHCFSSGMMLTASAGISQKLATTVFAALLAHKVYESLLLSSVLLVQHRTALWRYSVIGAYAGALPAGALLTFYFRQVITPGVAIMISSVAVGTLMACLIFDFLLPSFRHLRESRLQTGWLFVGLILTQLMMRAI